MAEILLQGISANVNFKKTDGTSAVILASQNGHANLVKLQGCQHRADVNLEGSHGMTALMLASQNGHANDV